MSFDRLHPEIWQHILAFLVIPLPKPLSGATKEEAVGEDPDPVSRLPNAGDSDTTSRRDIRVNDLATLARTSIAFNQLATPLLYKRVISDNLPLLTSHLNNPPAHPQIESKLQLVKRIRYLHLEYSEKARYPTYPEIMLDSRWLFRLGDPIDERIITHHAETEAGRIADCLTSLLVYPEPIFNSLITLSVASIFGPQHGVWRRAMRDDGPESFGRRMESCAEKMDPVFWRKSFVGHCQRGNVGPLAVSSSVPQSESTAAVPLGNTLLTAHFDEQSTVLPVHTRGPTRWIMEQRLRDELMHTICMLVCRHLSTFLRVTADYGHLYTIPFKITIFASGVRVGSQAGRQPTRIKTDVVALSTKAERELTHKLLGARPGAGTNDSVRLQSLPEASPCLACGWAFEPGGLRTKDEWVNGDGGWLNKYMT